MMVQNIKNDLQIVEENDKIYKKRELLLNFTDFLENSGFNIEKIYNESNSPYELLVLNNNKKLFRLMVHLKNITHAGWRNKPEIKRIQVKNIQDIKLNTYIKTHEAQALLVLGYYNFDNNPIMTAWDAYRYINHKTIRSCYITIHSLLRGYRKGFYTGTDSSQKVWVFNSLNFGTFLNDYISYKKDGDLL